MAFSSALNISNSSEFMQLAFRVERDFLSVIQSNISNAVAVQLISFSSFSNGTSIKVIVKIILIFDVQFSSTSQWLVLRGAIGTGISSTLKSFLNTSTSYGISYLTGMHFCFALSYTSY